MTFSTSAQADLLADVDVANQAFAKALMAKDIDRVVGFYTEDACVLAPGAGRICGLTAIREFWTGVANSGVQDVQIRTVDAGSDGSLGYSTGTLSVTDAEGVTHVSNYVLVLKQVEGGWMLLRDAWTPN